MYEACMCVPEFGVFLGDLGFVFRIISPLSVINICTEYIYIYIYRLLIKNVIEIQ